MEVSLIGQNILIVEDEPLIARDIAENFEHAGANIVIVYSCSAAIKAVQDNKFSAAILDGMIGDAELHQRPTAAGVPTWSILDMCSPLGKRAPTSTNPRPV